MRREIVLGSLAGAVGPASRLRRRYAEAPAAARFTGSRDPVTGRDIRFGDWLDVSAFIMQSPKHFRQVAHHVGAEVHAG